MGEKENAKMLKLARIGKQLLFTAIKMIRIRVRQSSHSCSFLIILLQ